MARTPEQRRRVSPTRSPSVPKPVPGQTDPDGERLSKRVAQAMGCSRREAEQYIAGGWVRVDGVVVEEPMARITDQRVTVDPDANLMRLSDVTLLLHKPPGFATMAALGEANQRVRPAQQLLRPDTHTPDDPSGLRVLKQHFAKLSACVPLETAASGLVVFTQDWRVLRKLTEDAAFIEHELLVDVRGEASPEQLHRLNHPPAPAHLTPPAVKVSVSSTGAPSTRLRFAFKGSHPGLIAWLCEQAGLQIVGIKRLRIGRVGLAHLPEGQWRFLGPRERF